MPRVPVTVTADEKRELQRRAKSHQTSMAGFLRTSALGPRAGGKEDPNAWWDTLPTSRRKQIMGWLTKPAKEGDPMPMLPFGDDESQA